MSTAKIIIGSLIGIGITALGIWVYKLKNLSEKLEIITKVRVHKVDFDGITLVVDATLKNPTTTPFDMIFPFVKLYYKDDLIGASEVISKTIKVPAQGEAHIKNISITLQGTSVLSTIKQMLQDKADGKAITLNAETISRIEFLNGKLKLPYSTNELIALSAKT